MDLSAKQMCSAGAVYSSSLSIWMPGNISVHARIRRVRSQVMLDQTEGGSEGINIPLLFYRLR